MFYGKHLIYLLQKMDVPIANRCSSFNLEHKSSAFSLGKFKSLIKPLSSAWMNCCGLSLPVTLWNSSSFLSESELDAEASSNFYVDKKWAPLSH